LRSVGYKSISTLSANQHLLLQVNIEVVQERGPGQVPYQVNLGIKFLI
jgi:hypothetical protein